MPYRGTLSGAPLISTRISIDRPLNMRETQHHFTFTPILLTEPLCWKSVT